MTWCPVPFFLLLRRRTLLAGLCSLSLGACGPGDHPATSGVTGAQVSGAILFPPQPGQVVLQATASTVSFPLVTFEVQAAGAYSTTLPAPSRLPLDGNIAELPLLPELPLLGLKAGSCAGRPQASDPAARVVLVERGEFRVDGQVTGQLLPAAQATGGTTANGDLVVSRRVYVFADRAVQISGVLGCAYTSATGQRLAGLTRTGYRLERGWNVLVSQTVQGTAEISTTLSSRPATEQVQWRYWPLSTGQAQAAPGQL